MMRRSNHRLPALRQLAPILGLAVVLAMSSPASAAAPRPAGAADSALAVFDGGAVFPSEFTRLYLKLLLTGPLPGPEDEARRNFLTRIVDRKLLAAEIASRPFTPSAAEQRQLDISRNQMVQNLLFRRTVGNLPDPTPDELEVFVRRQNKLAVARFIVFNDWDRARSWRNRLLTGTPMTALETAIQRDGPGLALLDSFQFYAAERLPDSLAQVMWSLRPGQVSELHSFGGKPTLMHLKQYEVRPARVQGEADIKSEFQKRKFDAVRERERLRLAESVGRRFEEDAMRLLLAAHMMVPPRSDIDSTSGLPVIRPNLPLPEISPADTGLVVARSRNGDTTIGAYLGYWGRMEPFTRPEIRERSSLEGAVDRVVLDGEILREAIAQGFDRDSMIVAQLASQRESYAMDDFFRNEIESKVSVSEKEMRALWAKDPAHYNEAASLEAHLISLDRKSQADSLLTRLQGGASFEPMAREFSNDMSTIESGGKTGIMYRGTQHNAGLENSMFATEVGALGGPEFTPEGWVIWRIDRKTPGVVRTFETAREMVERDAKIMAGERILEQKLAALRKRAHVKFYPERLAALPMR